MARFTQTGTTFAAAGGTLVQLSSTYPGGSVNVRLYATGAFNYVIGDGLAAGTAASAQAAAKVFIIPGGTYIDFGPVDPKTMWIVGNSVTGVVYWDTLA
jgi:hypothetical protein